MATGYNRVQLKAPRVKGIKKITDCHDDRAVHCMVMFSPVMTGHRLKSQVIGSLQPSELHDGNR